MAKVIGDTFITFYGDEIPVRVVQGEYPNKRIALHCSGLDGEPFGAITVNVPDQPLEEGEFFVKTWNENQWVPQLLNAPNLQLEDTGKRASTGYVEAQIWRFKNGETK